MAVFLVSLVFSFAFYLALTAGSGDALLAWSMSEAAAGLVFSVITAAVARKLLKGVKVRHAWGFFCPLRWAYFIAFALGPFLFSMARANVDVAWRVITGRISPRIVKVSSGLTNDFGIALLSNSITLTPGTLTVDADGRGNLTVHCIHMKKSRPAPEEVYGQFARWARRITQ